MPKGSTMEEMEERRLGHYEVLASLGAGGMGEVFRARDLRLDREVAVKLLPESLATDPSRLARLEREARLLASLSHPNIATVFELGTASGRTFVVLELVPGETLAHRLASGPLALDEVLDLFRQLADALDAAHEQGIVHRDLKPANLQITPDGRLKVLDFGLARGPQPRLEGEAISQTPTVSAESQPGRLLGTVPYMSPEQARGQPVDKRTDIWAFGCCLFEALSGRRAFEGETASDTLANILRAEPDWSLLPAGIPGSLRSLLRRCLAKELRQRQRDIGDVWLELCQAGGGQRKEVRSSTRHWAALGAALVLVLLLLLLVGLRSGRERLASWIGRPPPAAEEATEPTATRAPRLSGTVEAGDTVLTLEVDASDLVRSLDSSGKLDELELENKTIVFVVPKEPPVRE